MTATATATATATSAGWTRYPAWNDEDIATFTRRVTIFVRRGKTSDEAERLADRLFERDFDGDSRGTCLECRHLRRSGACGAGQKARLTAPAPNAHPLTDVLQQCDGFAPQED